VELRILEVTLKVIGKVVFFFAGDLKRARLLKDEGPRF